MGMQATSGVESHGGRSERRGRGLRVLAAALLPILALATPVAAAAWPMEEIDPGMFFGEGVMRAGLRPVRAAGDELRGRCRRQRRSPLGTRAAAGTSSRSTRADRDRRRWRASLAFDRAGNPALAYQGGAACRRGLSYASLSAVASGTLYRGAVSDLAAGWRSSSLPLGSLNDDPTPPFPVASASPGLLQDLLPGGPALVLYRFLGAGDADTGNRLRAVKSGAGAELSY